jgi:hypothetical protein
VSESEGSAATLEDTVAALTRFSGSIDIIGIPRLADAAISHPAFARIVTVIATLKRGPSSPPL